MMIFTTNLFSFREYYFKIRPGSDIRTKCNFVQELLKNFPGFTKLPNIIISHSGDKLMTHDISKHPDFSEIYKDYLNKLQDKFVKK